MQSFDEMAPKIMRCLLSLTRNNAELSSSALTWAWFLWRKNARFGYKKLALYALSNELQGNPIPGVSNAARNTRQPKGIVYHNAAWVRSRCQEPPEELIQRELLASCLASTMNARDRSIVMEMYLAQTTWAQAADAVGVARTTVQDIARRVRQRYTRLTRKAGSTNGN